MILNYKIRRMFALNFSKNYKCFEKLHQTLERAFLRISKHFKLKVVKRTRLHLVFSTHFAVFGYLMKYVPLRLIKQFSNDCRK